MITSFYFVMWILIYFLILISGNSALENYGFFIAFAGVYFAGMAANSMCRETIERRNRRDFLALMEIFYTGNHDRLCSIYHKKFLLLAASFIYMVIATAGLLLGGASWVIIAIFAFFTFTTGRSVHAVYAQYRMMSNASMLKIEQSGPLHQACQQYAAQRSVASFEQLCPKPTASEKALRIFNIIISVVCILIGLLFVYIYGRMVLNYGSHYPGAVINFAYGLLALVYGASDLYTLVKGFNFNILP